jgi:hypothetical protein
VKTLALSLSQQQPSSVNRLSRGLTPPQHFLLSIEAPLPVYFVPQYALLSIIRHTMSNPPWAYVPQSDRGGRDFAPRAPTPYEYGQTAPPHHQAAHIAPGPLYVPPAMGPPSASSWDAVPQRAPAPYVYGNAAPPQQSAPAPPFSAPPSRTPPAMGLPSVSSWDFIPSPHNRVASLNGPPVGHPDYEWYHGTGREQGQVLHQQGFSQGFHRTLLDRPRSTSAESVLAPSSLRFPTGTAAPFMSFRRQ